MGGFLNALKRALSSKSVWGAIVYQGIALTAGAHDPAAIGQALGVVLGVAGARDAVTKAAGAIAQGSVIAASVAAGSASVGSGLAAAADPKPSTPADLPPKAPSFTTSTTGR